MIPQNGDEDNERMEGRCIGIGGIMGGCQAAGGRGGSGVVNGMAGAERA